MSRTATAFLQENSRALGLGLLGGSLIAFGILNAFWSWVPGPAFIPAAICGYFGVLLLQEARDQFTPKDHISPLAYGR